MGQGLLNFSQVGHIPVSPEDHHGRDQDLVGPPGFISCSWKASVELAQAVDEVEQSATPCPS